MSSDVQLEAKIVAKSFALSDYDEMTPGLFIILGTDILDLS